MSKSLVIFEFVDEVEAFIAQKSIDALKDKNNYIIAVWPKVRAYLKKINVSCCGTYNFFGKEGHQKVLLKSDSIYHLFRSDLNETDDIYCLILIILFGDLLSQKNYTYRNKKHLFS